MCSANTEICQELTTRICQQKTEARDIGGTRIFELGEGAARGKAKGMGQKKIAVIGLSTDEK